MPFAVRLNSFLTHGETLTEALDRIGSVAGITHIDLNYPEHFQRTTLPALREALAKRNLRVNAINMRYPAQYLNGAFTNPDPLLRARAIDLTKEACALLETLDGDQVIVWLAYDGYDYPFQIDYAAAWDHLTDAFRQVCASTDRRVSIEYKPYEERSFSLLDSFGATWSLLRDVGAPNLGMTLDFCHMLMKKENPAFAAEHLLCRDKLFCVHLNDGFGHTDSGLMTGMVTPWQTLELLYVLRKHNYAGGIYFDTFPRRERAEDECAANLRMIARMNAWIDRTGLDRIGQVVASCDAVAVQQMLSTLFD